MPGNRAAVLGLARQHVAAVPLGDDLILQILRRVLAAQVRLERAAQPRPLLAQPVANQLAAPGWRDRRPRRTGRSSRATCADLALERRGAAAGRVEQRKRSAARGGCRRARRRPNRGTSRARAAAAPRARALRPRAPRESAADRPARAAATAPCRAEKRTVSRGRRQQLRPPAPDRSTARSRARRSAPIGVSAKPRTASTIRSNSRARRAPGCIGETSDRLRPSARAGNL